MQRCTVVSEVPNWLGYVCNMRGIPVAGRSLMEFVRELENIRSVCRVVECHLWLEGGLEWPRTSSSGLCLSWLPDISGRVWKPVHCRGSVWGCLSQHLCPTCLFILNSAD